LQAGIATIVLLSTPAIAQVQYPAETVNGPSPKAATTTELEDFARQLSGAHQRADRLAAYDAACPASPEERRALGANCVILVSAVSANAAELPLSRVYLHPDAGDDTELRRLADFASDIPQGSPLQATVGDHRIDAFYLAPLTALAKPGAILIDFATARTGFKVGALPLRMADASAGRASEPDPAALAAFIRREYPGWPTPRR
jgi:hypothetical protein